MNLDDGVNVDVDAIVARDVAVSSTPAKLRTTCCFPTILALYPVPVVYVSVPYPSVDKPDKALTVTVWGIISSKSVDHDTSTSIR